MIVQIVENSAEKGSVIARNNQLQKDSVTLNQYKKRNFSTNEEEEENQGGGCC